MKKNNLIFGALILLGLLILSANTGQPFEKIAFDTERDNYMSAEEAMAYGLIDGIVTRKE